MIVVTTPFLSGHRIVESKGMVFGLVVRSRGLGGNLMAGLRSLGGGEIHEYTSLLEDTRRQALDRLVSNATLLGANAVLSMRFDSSELSGTMSEIVAYGTAVIVAPDASATAHAGHHRRMTGGLGVAARIVVLAIGLTMFVAGLATMALGGGAAFIGGLLAACHRDGVHRRGAHRAGPLSLGRGWTAVARPTGPAGGEPRARASSRVSGAATRSSSIPTSGHADARLARPGERRAAVPRRRNERGGVLSSPAGARTSRRPRRRGANHPRWPRSIPAHPPVPRSVRTPASGRAARRRRYPYLNRELSWLEFNARVLHEARDERNPLLERVKFLAIFAGNLDEFFQVRVAGLRQQVEAGKVARSPDGRTADEQLAAVARARPRARRRPFGDLHLGPPGARGRGRRAGRLRRDPGASRGAPPALPRRDLPGPDAARGRPRVTRSRTSRR